MIRSRHRAAALVLAFALLVPTAAAAAPARAKPAAIAPLKARQIRLLADEALRLRRAARARGRRARPEAPDAEPRLPALRQPFIAAGAPPLPALAPNVRCNDPSGDLPSAGAGGRVIEGQCETAIARWGSHVITAWNDGKGFDDGSGQTIGWASSSNGGATWLDHGTFPLPASPAGWTWMSDPVLAVNERTGRITFAALGGITRSLYTVGVVSGRFSGDSVVWGPVSIVGTRPVATDILDKEWLAVDPADGRVYVSYTDFEATGNAIQVQSADSALTSWSAPLTISAAGESGRVQGSRVAVASDGSVVVAYYLVGTQDVDFLRVARSADRGATFGAAHDAVSFFANYGTGSPGFNRPLGIEFPSLAVDRSGHLHDGRIHLAWSESLNWYDDFPNRGSGATVVESEPNNNYLSADPAAVGDVIRGSCGTSRITDAEDWYAVPLTAGSTLLAAVDSLENGQTVSMRLVAPDGATSLAWLQASNLDILYGTPPAWIYTAPADGTYFLRIAAVQGFGWYRVDLGVAQQGGERGRDQRDVFSAYSDDGGSSWSTPVRVNAEPPGYDDWLPEIAVSPSGQLACAWYDWRDSGADMGGGMSSVYLATSDDDGDSWRERGSVASARSPWSYVASNIVPNQGDYFALRADAAGYSLAWSDGRSGNPDVYSAAISPDSTGMPPAATALRLRLGAGPATQSARFEFDLPASARVRLVLYDVQGRLVRELVAGDCAAGAHVADWDLRDGNGARAGAGVYWARLTAPGGSATTRLVVLR